MPRRRRRAASSKASSSRAFATSATRWSSAQLYSEAGADELVFLDIKATLDSRPAQIALVERVAERVAIPFTVGGGVRTVADADALLRAGADKVAVNSAALERPILVRELAERVGSQAVVVAIDATRGRRALARRDDRDRPRRRRVGTRGRAAGRGGDPAHLDRRGRNARRIRPPADGGRCGGRDGAGDRVGWRRGGGSRRRSPRVAQAALLASILHEDPARLTRLRAELRSAGVPLRDAA